MLNNSHNLSLSKYKLVLVIGVFLAALVYAATSVSSPMRSNHSLIQNVEHLMDTQEEYSITNIFNVSDTAWQKHNQDPTSLGMSDKLHWFRFTLSHIDPAQTWLLEIDYALLDSVHLWFVQEGKVLSEQVVGDSLKFSQRTIKHENFLFPIPTNGRPIEVYIRSYSKGAMRLPINIWQQTDYLEFSSKSRLIMGVFFGLMLAMGLSNLFFYLTTRTPTFLVYTGYVVFLTLTLSALQGLGYRYIWPDSPWLQQHAVGIFGNIALWFSVIFCDLLLNAKAHSKKLSKLLKITAYSYLLSLAISLFTPLQIFNKIFLLMLCTSGVFILAVAIWLRVKGVAIAGYYLFSWAVLYFSALVVSLNAINIINLSLPSYYLLMCGACIETILLALILAINHNKQRQELLDTQVELLHQERQVQHAQKDMLTLQENATEDLEYKVQERTLELEVAFRELSDTNRELQEKNTLDALTGIRNRSYFDKKYQAEVRRSRREQTQLSIVMMDIDHFKSVNDQYGHLVGDECIKTVANTLKKALKRPSDDVCRYGGEEFALILPSTDLEGALVLIEQLRVEIQQTKIQVESQSVAITISAGIGTAVADLNQPEDIILALADKQLYTAKNAGRNNVKGSYLEATQQQDQ